MKRNFIILAALVAGLTFSACDFSGLNDRDTDSEIIIPEDKDNPNNKPSIDDNTSNEEDEGGNTEDTTNDRSQYEQHNTTFTQGDAIYFGSYYDEQPSDVYNWWIELADNNFSLEDYSGEGYNIVLEFFSKGTTPAAGTYTIEAFDKNPFAHMTLLYGYIDEYEGENYPMGTWLYQGLTAIACATDGSMTIAVSGSKYTVSYTLHDDDYKITFKGTYTGELPLYDGTETESTSATQKVSKSSRNLAGVKPIRLLRVKK